VGFIAGEIPAGASSFLQFAVSAVLSALCLPLIPGGAVWPGDLLRCWDRFCIWGRLAPRLCFFMQVHAQKRVTPSRAAVILSTESVFGSMFSVLLDWSRCAWGFFWAAA
jgi:drug/metabolite transporter (DMT)-like permease